MFGTSRRKLTLQILFARGVTAFPMSTDILQSRADDHFRSLSCRSTRDHDLICAHTAASDYARFAAGPQQNARCDHHVLLRSMCISGTSLHVKSMR